MTTEVTSLDNLGAWFLLRYWAALILTAFILKMDCLRKGNN